MMFERRKKQQYLRSIGYTSKEAKVKARWHFPLRLRLNAVLAVLLGAVLGVVGLLLFELLGGWA